MSSTAHEPSYADCFRALGVHADASWEEIRQAYKDLVRVWHPDRFQSDPMLQQRAEQQLQRINEAYFNLKNRQTRVPRAEPEPPPRPPEPAPAVHVPPDPRVHVGTDSRLQFQWPARVAYWGLVCLAPLVVGGWLLNRYRIPTLDSFISRNAPPRAGLLTPSQFGGPFGERRATPDELSSWARGEAADLWTSIRKVGPKSADESPQPASQQALQPGIGAPVPGTPPNGTELRHSRMYGGSELWVSNPTNHDAIATLVESETAAPLRVVYIQAKNKVCIRHIAPGLYDLLAEAGDDWDTGRLRFRTRLRTFERTGPFQCLDVTSAQGTYGPKFHVVLGSR